MSEANLPQQADLTYVQALRNHQAGRYAAAVEGYRNYLAQRPGDGNALNGLVDALAASGRYGEAGEALEKWLISSPDDIEALFKHAYLLIALGKHSEAVSTLEKLIGICPQHAEAHHRLASVLSEQGKISQSFFHYMERAKYAHVRPERSRNADPPHKIKHDQEQKSHIGATGSSSGAAALFNLGNGDRIAGRAINVPLDNQTLLEKWRNSAPQLIVIDDFLTADALTSLRIFCANSTVWRRVYESGYLGAMPADGFACPMLAQIVEEIMETWPTIFSGHRFAHLGAFKYDSTLSKGTNIHADLAAINVNLYLAPDCANLDAGSGGMKIWDVCASSEEEMRHYNSNETQIEARLKGIAPLTIPHKANRAIIFKSSLFHKTDEFRFSEGYLNRRINVSMLFGRFGDATC